MHFVKNKERIVKLKDPVQLRIWEEAQKTRENDIECLYTQQGLIWLAGRTEWIRSSLERMACIGQSAERFTLINRYGRDWTHESMKSHLQRCGIQTSPQAVWGRKIMTKETRYVRTVTFWVNQFDIAACGTTLIQPNGYMQVQPVNDWQKPPYRRLGRIAIRAAYALSWDTLQITLQGIPHDPNVHVTAAGVLDEPQEGDVVLQCFPVSRQATPSWVWKRYEEQLLKQAKEFAHYVQHREHAAIKYGMDLEYVLKDASSGSVISASRFLPYGGVAGCDAVRIHGRVLYPLMELRPRPSTTLDGLLHHLHDAMLQAWKWIDAKLKDYKQHKPNYVNSVKWCGGSLPHPLLPIGGHLHVSGIPLTPEMSRALDMYVALPVSLLEPTAGEGTSRRPKYGMLGDIRMQEYQGEGGFEYRTLPCFAITPELTMEVLSLFAAAVEHYRELSHRDSLRPALVYSFTEGHKEQYRELAQTLLMDIAARAGGSKRFWIERLHERIKNGWTWNESEDLSSAWL
ncbi:putative amidoligase domain-containing protein [Paenibacillus sp. 1001270B_150601_E10]|uniref:putative amidoligase domain-containing protein n=1 Tax=Paenibacillus sp. 1001270B_150601_E10 TaxID=2787079 RepID=UPI00189CC794|nr:hypothetical protein [Paenibacillus sp. 1001270B_150601_E10]